MSELITAHTAKNNDYPAFIRVIKKENGNVSIIVRSQGTYEQIGDVAEIEMSLEEFVDLTIEAGQYLAGYNPVDPNQKELDLDKN